MMFMNGCSNLDCCRNTNLDPVLDPLGPIVLSIATMCFTWNISLYTQYEQWEEVMSSYIRGPSRPP